MPGLRVLQYAGPVIDRLTSRQVACLRLNAVSADFGVDRSVEPQRRGRMRDGTRTSSPGHRLGLGDSG